MTPPPPPPQQCCLLFQACSSISWGVWRFEFWPVLGRWGKSVGIILFSLM
jgi:hypothetical protein